MSILKIDWQSSLTDNRYHQSVNSRVNALPTVVKAGVNFQICGTFSHKYTVEKCLLS